MSETVFQAVSSYGIYVIFASAFLSCLALPIPTSLMMLSGGAFAASGDLALWQVVAAAFCGAVIGDQTGYLLGRYGGSVFIEKIARNPTTADALKRAQNVVDRYGGVGVFFSTWLTAPLGPWVNFLAGATGLGWARFTVWDIFGEAVWVLLYVSLGFTFASHITAVAEVMSDIIGLIVALAVVAIAALWLRSARRRS